MPMIPLTFVKDGVALNYFSMITTAGTPQTVTAEELRLECMFPADEETEALRRRSELEQRSMQEVARQAIREYIENHSRSDLLGQVLDDELPRYAEALRRLGE